MRKALLFMSLVVGAACSENSALPGFTVGDAAGGVGMGEGGTAGGAAGGLGGSAMGAGGMTSPPNPGTGAGGNGAGSGGTIGSGGSPGTGGNVQPKVDASVPGVKCGDNTCAAGLVCCNPSCGICTPPNGACIQLFCLPKVDAGVASGGTCKVDGDCRLFDDYCTGCDCRALNKTDADPKCSGPEVRCLVQPCANKTAVCEAGKCVARAKDAAAPLKWFATCGDPVCRVGGWRDKGLPKCTTEKAGGACTKSAESCDPGLDCNGTLICQATDPMMAPGGCPKSRASTKRDYLGPMT